MTPFQQFRIWFRRANVAVRVLTAAVTVAVAMSATWLALPSETSSEAAAFPTTDAGGNAAGECVEGTDTGLTETTVKVAVTVVALPATGNESVGVPSPEGQEEDFQIAVDGLNAAGGAGCRQIELEFFRVNPIDPSATQATCLDIVAAEPFIALDTGALGGTGAADCIPKAKIPLASFGGSISQLKKYYPYFLKPAGTIEQVLRNGPLAWEQMGLLTEDQGFAKLGMLTKSCNPDYNEAMTASLEEVGVAGDDVVTYDLGCPFGAASNADLQQAVLAFKNAGVTHVTEVDDAADFPGFTKVAAAQDFEPQYLLADDALMGIAIEPDPDNIAGAVNVASSRYGEESTPGFEAGGATQECNEVFEAAGRTTVYEQPAGYGGIACGLLAFVKAAVDHLPTASREAVAAGMHDIGNLDLPYPQGPVDFSAVPPGTPYGAYNWRVATFDQACECWLVDDPTFNPPFS